MFGIGAQELIVILVIALLVFGPKRLPELARSLGKGLAEFRRASTDLRQSLSADPAPPPEAPAARANAQAAPSVEAGEPAQAVAAPEPERETDEATELASLSEPSEAEPPEAEPEPPEPRSG